MVVKGAHIVLFCVLVMAVMAGVLNAQPLFVLGDSVNTHDLRVIRAEAYGIRYTIELIVAVIAAVLAWVIRMVMWGAAQQQKRRIKGYFATEFRSFTHASKNGDTTGIASGRYRLRYPRLMVGETVVDVRGALLDGDNALALKNGDLIEFYTKEAPQQERHEDYVPAPRRTQHLPW